MRYTFAFGLVAAVAAVAAFVVPGWVFPALLWWVASSFALAAAAYAGVGPRLLGKRADGTLPAWSYALHGPFLLLGLVSMRMVHLTSGEAPFHEVAPGVFLGRRPTRRDRAVYRQLGIGAVLDLCAELQKSSALEGRERYLTLPVLDADAPSPEQLVAAVRWLDEVLPGQRVLVHCALGHGRSATVIAAWRLHHGAAGDALDVEADLRRTRPGVRFTPAQHLALEVWRRGLPGAR
jgi:protein-tyrosine phosphatase